MKMKISFWKAAAAAVRASAAEGRKESWPLASGGYKVVQLCLEYERYPMYGDRYTPSRMVMPKKTLRYELFALLTSRYASRPTEVSLAKWYLDHLDPTESILEHATCKQAEYKGALGVQNTTVAKKKKQKRILGKPTKRWSMEQNERWMCTWEHFV